MRVAPGPGSGPVSAGKQGKVRTVVVHGPTGLSGT